MTDSQKLDLILSRLDGSDKRFGNVEEGISLLNKRLGTIENEIVNVNRRLTIMEGELKTINLKVDELRSWTQVDLRDNPFLKNRSEA